MRATMRHRQPAKAGCVGAPVVRNPWHVKGQKRDFDKVEIVYSS